MKVATWYNNRDIRIEEVPTPKPGPHEMLVRVISCGICGSDVVEWYRLPRAPLVQGHEVGGEVVSVGNLVDAYRPGDRVFVAPKVSCMECYYCENEVYPVCSNVKERLSGGFAEFVLVPEALVKHGTYRLPVDVSFDQSTFIEPLACVVRAQRLAGIRKGQTVLIIGCGMSGLLHIKLAKTKGCRIVATDINPKKLDYAKTFGAETTLNAAEDVPQALLRHYGRKADVVILCASALSAVHQAWNSVDRGGAVLFFAVPGPDKTVEIPINTFWTQEIRILTSYYCGPPDIKESLHLIESGKLAVDDLITHKLPLGETAKGFQIVSEGGSSIKVIITPNETA